MTTWQFNSEEKAGTLVFEGDLTISHVAAVKERLVEAFSDAEQVTIDLSAAAAVDVAGVQLLCACQRYASGHGKSMFLSLGDNSKFSDFLDEVGFSQTFNCAGNS